MRTEVPTDESSDPNAAESAQCAGRATPERAARVSATRAGIPRLLGPKASAALALPGLCSRRVDLRRERARHRDTAGGDAIVLVLMKACGVLIVIGVAGVLAAGAYDRAGAATGFVVGALALASGQVLAWGAVQLWKRHLARQESRRQSSVLELTAEIRRLDQRIARAFTDHGLLGSPPNRGF